MSNEVSPPGVVVTTVACPLCGALDPFVLQRTMPLAADDSLVVSTLIGAGAVLSFRACRHCGLLFRDPRPTPEHLTHYYTVILPRLETGIMASLGVSQADAARRNDRRYRLLYEELSPRSLAKPGANGGVRPHVIDIGGWDGRALLPWLDAGWRATLIEPGAGKRSLARDDIVDKRSVSEALASPNPTADVITSYHCIEHVLDVGAWFRDARPLSRRGTLWVVEVPFEVITIKGLLQRRPAQRATIHDEHLNFFTPRSLESLAALAGLRVLDVRIVITPYWFGPTVALRLYARDEGGAASARPPEAFRSERGLRAHLRLRMPVWRRWAGLKFRYHRRRYGAG